MKKRLSGQQWLIQACATLTIISLLGCESVGGLQGPEGEKGDTGEQGEPGFIYYFDNFNRAQVGSSWTPYGDVILNIVDNRLQIQGTSPDYLSGVDLKKPRPIADFTLEVDTKQISALGNGFGILFRDSGSNKQYRIAIDEGSYAIFRGIDHLNVKWNEIPGTNTTQTYRITIRCISSLIECYINNYPVFIGEDNTYSAGSLGFFVSNQTIAQFDNLKLQAFKAIPLKLEEHGAKDLPEKPHN